MQVKHVRLVIGVGIAFWSALSHAHLPVEVCPKSNDGMLYLNWTPVQLGVFPSSPWQIVSGKADVYGVAVGILGLRQQSAIVSAGLENKLCENNLLQLGLIDVCERNYAIGIAPFCIARRNFGVDVGLLNLESNFGERQNDDHPNLPGIQIGIFNVGGGVQLGLLNYNPQGLVKWLPLVNFPWKEDNPK